MPLRQWVSLKEQCHEDFAVLGQFCAKIITFEALIIKNASVKLRARSFGINPE